LQDVPDAQKQAKWEGQQPGKFDWDKELKQVLEEGKEVPEVEWCKSGEDAAWEVGPLLLRSSTTPWEDALYPPGAFIFKG